MKTNLKTYLTLLVLFVTAAGYSQADVEGSKKLVKEGVVLHDDGKYNEAIDKYNQAIKLDPQNPTAYFEKGYTLLSTGKGKDAIPVIEKVLELDPKSGGAYDMLGTIYDDDKQTDKAIEMYKKGILMDPDYERLHFNLGITYLRQKNYPEAETCAIDAIKLDPKHASSMRLYALATYNQQKRDCSLLAWCSFLMLEPATKRSAEGYNYVRNILSYGVSQTDEKHINISISPNEISAGSLGMKLAVVAATEGKTNLSTADSLSLQLTSVFKVISELQAQKQQPFFNSYFAQYFKKLAESDHMPAFTRLISYGAKKDESQSWFGEHKTELTAFNDWVSKTERNF